MNNQELELMPKALEAKLKKEYPDNPNAVYGTMNMIEKKKRVAQKMTQAQRIKHNARANS